MGCNATVQYSTEHSVTPELAVYSGALPAATSTPLVYTHTRHSLYSSNLYPRGWRGTALIKLFIPPLFGETVLRRSAAAR